MKMTHSSMPKVEDIAPPSTGIIAYGEDFSSEKHPAPRRSPYAAAPLIAQLLATYDQHPQWRTNRRLDAPSALRAYQACANGTPARKNPASQI